MGWNIFRRTALVLIVLTSGALCATGSDLPRKPQPAVVPKPESETPPYRSARQNHAPEEAWTIDIDSVIGKRPEVAYWITQWSSDDGIGKIRTSLGRYHAYRPSVTGIFRASRLPWELVYLPIVESNWRIDAVSSSGAVGPWQFLESTARGRGLVIDAWRDERRNVEKSTDAAVRELAFYHRLYDDWLLTIASYNAGPTRIGRLRQESGLDSYWELRDSGLLPPETRNYVPQILAVTYIISHSGRFGLPIRWDVPMEWESVELNRSISLALLSDESGIGIDVLIGLNRDLNHPFTPPPDVNYRLKIPSGAAAGIRSILESPDVASMPLRFWRYTVRSGDTLSELASRSGISQAELLLYNDHVRNRMLRIGDRLYLPGTGEPPPGAEVDDLPEWTGRYRVEPGDTYWGIARRFGVAPEILAEVNHRPLSDVLMAGSLLKVPLVGEDGDS